MGFHVCAKYGWENSEHSKKSKAFITPHFLHEIHRPSVNRIVIIKPNEETQDEEQGRAANSVEH